MGSSAERKRKRAEENEGDIAQPSKKVQVTESAPTSNGTTASEKRNKEKTSTAGAIRQLKSERRSKKGLNSKKNATRKEDTLPRSDGPDTLASGEDFVSLLDKPAVKSNRLPKPQAAVLPSQASTGKPKKSSPRSISKAAKAEKITTAMEEEGLVAADGGLQESKNNSRFICFVGNLPFNATTAQIEAHFVKLRPKAVRHSTDKKTGKSKGFAFLEFDDYDRMKTCLQNYHQSIFEPNAGEVKLAGEGKKKTQGRKLNVELTAGGGGNTQSRVEKIKEKNNKLTEERTRRKIDQAKEAQDKLKKRREQSEKSREKSRARGPSGANTEAITDTRGIHPSRLNRVPQED